MLAYSGFPISAGQDFARQAAPLDGKLLANCQERRAGWKRSKDLRMRLLLICLLVSIGALLAVAAGVARHIWVRRAKFLRQAPESAISALDAALGPAGDPDNELET
jgi:hypothetical protein